jgi:diguanylate cyclase (GGDEF)-like protein
MDELEQLIARADASALTDPLTGLANRRRASLELERAVELAERHRRPLSALRIEVAMTPTAPAADQALLQAVARALGTALRLPDLPARWSDRGFVVVLPETVLAGAEVVAARLVATAERTGATVAATCLERERGESAASLAERLDAIVPAVRDSA